MGAYEANEYAVGVIMDENDETVSVALDVENYPVVRDDVGAAIVVLDVLKRPPVGGLGFVVPSLQRLFRIGVRLPELPKLPDRDYVHGTIGILIWESRQYSQNGNVFLFSRPTCAQDKL
jgi:hypothetical protein